MGLGGIGSAPWVAAESDQTTPPPPPPLRSSADVRVCSVRGPQGGLDGRGGEGVGGDWRGVSVDSPSDSVQK